MSSKLPKKSSSAKSAFGGSVKGEQAVLIAGAAGFLGSHLTETLLATEAKVIGVDDFTTGDPKNIEQFKKHSNFNFIEANINEALPKSLFTEPISHIVHVANIETYLKQEELELNHLLANSFGVKNLLDLTVANKATFLFTSSMDIYTGLASHTNLEHYYDGIEAESRFSYLEAKRYAEALCQQYVDLYNLDIRIARLSEVYGPRMALETNSLLARLIRLTLEGKDLIIDEEGSREHILCFVSDIVYGLNKLLFSDASKAQKGIFYFANPERVSTLSIAYTLREYTNREMKVDFMPAKKHFVPITTRKVDISRTRRELYWEPKVDITEGLRITLEFFQQKSRKGLKGIKKVSSTGTQNIEDIQTAQVQTAKEGIKRRLKKPAIEPVKTKLLQKPKGWLSLIRQPLPQKNFTRGLGGFTLKGVESMEGKERKIKQIAKFAAMLLLAALVFGPPILTCAFAGKTLLDLNQSKDAAFSQNLRKTQENLAQAQTNLLRTQKNLHWSRFLLSLFGQNQRLEEVDKILTASFFALDTAKIASDGFFALNTIFNKIKLTSPVFGGKPLAQEQEIDLTDARLSLELANKRFALAVKEISDLDQDTLCFGNLFNCKQKIKKIKEFSMLGQRYLNISEDLFLHLPQMLGLKSPAHYLILLQNNTELRATGGFLGSYAIFTFENSTLTNLQVNDIYNPDGLLQQKITAPEAVKKYMDVSELGIRDSNWWPHFPESAEKIATLYEFAAKDQVDFVIAINLDVVKNLLGSMGPIELPKYNETITADNLFERAEVHSEVGFTAGSTQKQDFLANLTDELIKKLTGTEQKESESAIRQLAERIAKALGQSLLQKEILLYARDETIEKLFINASFAGDIAAKPKGDYLFVVDSNVGGNKSNFWITRSTKYELSVDRDSNLTADLTVSWNHTGTSHTWPSGDYKNYLRVYVPKGANLIEESGFADVPEIDKKFDKTVFGGLVKVPINSTHSVHLKYTLPKEIGFSEKDTYTFLTQKQSGISAEPFSFKLTLPAFLKTITGESEITWDETLTSDKTFTIKTEGGEY